MEAGEQAAGTDSATHPWRILCVDDEQNILSSLRRLLRQDGYEIHAALSGQEGLDILRQTPIDLVISDMRMPEMDGAEFLARVCEEWPDTVRILLTGYADINSTISAINRGEIYRYITKPWDDADLRLGVRHALGIQELKREKIRLEGLTARQNEELRELNASLEEKVATRTADLRKANEQLKSSFITTIKVFTNLLELRAENLAGHSRRVADAGRKIGVQLGLSENELNDIFVAGLLHDIGKIGLSDTLIAKPVSLMSGEEIGAYRKHPVKGEQLLMAIDDLHNAAKIVRFHHENFDGSGYPEGIAESMIPIGARILAVANDYDAYRAGTLSTRRHTQEEAMRLLIENSGGRYDPEVVAAMRMLLAGKKRETAQQEVPINALRAGMVLGRDLLTRDGALLLSAEHVLDDVLIRKIHDYARVEGLPNLRLSVRSEG